MAKRFYEFCCPFNHISEAYIDSEVRTTECKECGEPAERIVSTPRISLEGTTGAFPGAAMQWERKHAEKLAQERKAAALGN